MSEDELEKRVEKAVHYLIDSSDEYARARSHAKSLLFKLKSTEATEYLEVTEGTIREKEMKARASEPYKNIVEEYENAEYHSELINSRRESARLLISYYQSIMRAKTGGY